LSLPRSQEIFYTARRRAFIQDVLAELSGKPDDLLSFDAVREQLHLTTPTQDASVEEISLDKVVGSVGRYRDFNRAFLPRGHINAERWTRIQNLQSQAALPPIDVFQVGDVYFVRDGNHRVSVARTRKQQTIQARVVQVPVRVPLEPDTSPDDLILKSGYTEFLEKTSLDFHHPKQHIELTRAGGYRNLLQHVEIHQFYMGLRSRHYPSLEEAAADWYQEVYLPVVERIQDSKILERFSGRTEGDLYLWIAQNRARLQMRYGVQEEAEEAVRSFAQEHRDHPLLQQARNQFQRFWSRLRPSRPQPASPPPPDKNIDQQA